MRIDGIPVNVSKTQWLALLALFGIWAWCALIIAIVNRWTGGKGKKR